MRVFGLSIYRLWYYMASSLPGWRCHSDGRRNHFSILLNIEQNVQVSDTTKMHSGQIVWQIIKTT